MTNHFDNQLQSFEVFEDVAGAVGHKDGIALLQGMIQIPHAFRLQVRVVFIYGKLSIEKYQENKTWKFQNK